LSRGKTSSATSSRKSASQVVRRRIW
jgi:hypothetical protein